MPPAPPRSSRAAVAVAVVLMVGLGMVWVRGNASVIRQAERLTEALGVGAGAARLAHEVQRERDLSAYYVASGRRLDYGGMLAQRVWVYQASRAFEKEVGRLRPLLADHGQALAASLDQAGDRLAALDRFRRERIDAAGIEVGTAEALRWFSTTVDALLGVVAEVARIGGGSALGQDLETVIALGQYKEAVAQERSYLYATYAAGGFAQVPSGDAEGADPTGTVTTGANLRSLPHKGFTSILGNKAAWRSRFGAVAAREWDERLSAALEDGTDLARVEAVAEEVGRDPTAVQRTDPGAVKAWFFSMNSVVDALRRLENRLITDVTTRAEAAGQGAAPW